MPAGRPDPRFRFLPQERSDLGGGVDEGHGGGTPFSPSSSKPSLPGRETQQEYVASVDVVRGYAERLIEEAMEAGAFDDLPGTGKPIPGAGRVDDELWWVRSWLEHNQDQR